MEVIFSYGWVLRGICRGSLQNIIKKSKPAGSKLFFYAGGDTFLLGDVQIKRKGRKNYPSAQC